MDLWEREFLIRSDKGLKSRPHFRLAEGKVEFFVGPAVMVINDDGSLLYPADDRRSNATHMVIEFRLNQDIDTQLERARRWLIADQKHRFIENKIRRREDKFCLYLRGLDAHKAGENLDEIARILYPHLDNSYPSYEGKKQASKALKAAVKLSQRGLRPPMNRR